jgi:hypothetical protein
MRQGMRGLDWRRLDHWQRRRPLAADRRIAAIEHFTEARKLARRSVQVDHHRDVVGRLRLIAFLLVGIGRGEAFRQGGRQQGVVNA